MSTIRLRRKLRHRTGLMAFIAILCTSLLNPSSALAQLTFTAPITGSNGTVACATCATESAPSQYGIPVWSTTQELGVIATDADTTKMLFSGGASANPGYRALAIGDIPDSLKTGTVNETGVVTYAAGSKTTGKQVQFDSDGNLEASATDIGAGSSIVPTMDFSPMTVLTVTDATDVFCGFDGSCSTTANGADVQTPFDGSGTFEGVECRSTGTTGTAITVDLDFGTCGAALSTGTATAAMATTAWGAPTSQTGSSAFTDGQCGVFRFSTAGGDATASLRIRCTVRKTVGA